MIASPQLETAAKPCSTVITFIRFALFMVLAGGLAHQWFGLHTWQDREFIDTVRIHLPPGSSRVLGRDEMAAPMAAAQHLKVVRTDDAHWSIFNVAESRQLAVGDAQGWQHLRQVKLTPGMLIRVGQGMLTVTAISPQLSFQTQSGVFHYDGAHLTGPHASIDCADDSLLQRVRSMLRHSWNKIAPPMLRVHQPLSLGGLVTCANRFSLEGLPSGALRIDQNRAGEWLLRASSISAREVCVVADRNEACEVGHSLFMQGRPITGGETLVIGRSRYQLQFEPNHPDVLIHQAQSRTAWTDQTLPLFGTDGLTWRSKGFQLWAYPADWPSPLLVSSGLLLALAAGAAFLQARLPTVSALNALSLPLALLLLLMSALLHVTESSLGLGWTWLLLGFAVMTWSLLSPPSIAAAIVLTGVALTSLMGLGIQLELGLIATDTGGLRHWRSAAHGFGVFTGVLLGMQALQHLNTLHPFKKKTQDGWSVGVLILAAAALFLLMSQAVWGSEGGVFGLQPVELGKLALIMLAARVAAQWACFSAGGAALWIVHLQGLVLVLLYVAIMAAALLLVRDFSPLVLIGFWALGFLIASAATTQKNSMAMSIIVMLVTLAPLAYLLQPQVFELLHTQGIYGDRLDVWLDPHLHPHSGEQFLRAQQLMATHDWPSGWSVPAVHDDFILSFIVARGGLALLALFLFAQALLILGLVVLAIKHLTGCHLAPTGAYRLHGRFIALVLVGAAAVVLGHMVISLGTNFGYLPVMGQPMVAVSAGNSIRLMFLLPIIVLALQAVTPGKVQASLNGERTP